MPHGSDHSHHLRELAGFFGNSTICRSSFRLLIHFATRMAAAGHANHVLLMVEQSPEIELFEPLADGLRLHLGLPVVAEGEALELAKQIAAKIDEEIADHRGHHAHA